jgi:hypothetical protein
MSSAPSNEQDEPDRANTMKEQLRKDAASWSAARSEGSLHQTEEFSVAVARPSMTQPVKRAKPPATPAIKPAAGPKKPFSMSYDGTTTADHITHMIARGAR